MWTEWHYKDRRDMAKETKFTFEDKDGAVLTFTAPSCVQFDAESITIFEIKNVWRIANEKYEFLQYKCK